MNYISEHAIKRFKERYNMELSQANYFVHLMYHPMKMAGDLS